MKEFLKYTFATVCGLILTGVVFTILGIISLAGMVASTSGTETIVKDRSVFVLELKGSVMERYQENPIMQFLGEDYATYGLDDILTSIRKAKENDKIKGIYIDAGAFACQTASMQAIRRALVDFKESGKFIVAYAGAYSQGTYYIASVADKGNSQSFGKYRLARTICTDHVPERSARQSRSGNADISCRNIQIGSRTIYRY